MPIRTLIASAIGRLLSVTLKILPYSGGGAAPGLVALKIDPDFLKNQAQRCQAHIVVSGTNGKTTTTRMISSILKAAHIPHIHNRSGSNLKRGIASTFLSEHFPKSTKIKPIGIWEVDEAVLPAALKQLEPSVVVLTNLFRDQLDRYGEMETLARKWFSAFKKINPKTTLILNGDDATLIALAKELKNPVKFYGIKDLKNGQKTPTHAADTTFCPHCFKPLKYQIIFYSHLGKFSCSCGFKQPKKDLYAQDIRQKTQHLKATVKLGIEKLKLRLPLTGLFNLYNALAALAVAKTLKLDLLAAKSALNRYQPAFGRMETVRTSPNLIEMILVKNPTAFNQVITTLKNQPFKPVILIAINDQIADGTDVSWLWDVDFQNLKGKISQVIVTGRRFADMAVRLKYANIDPKQMKTLTPNLKAALKSALKVKNRPVYILPNYTAMLAIRKILFRWGLIHSSWKD